MKIYTRTGDDGTTGLIGGQRVAKSDPRIDCYGTVDELNANLMGWQFALRAPASSWSKTYIAVRTKRSPLHTRRPWLNGKKVKVSTGSFQRSVRKLTGSGSNSDCEPLAMGW